MASERPHLIIGVDLGMTCTGVSYANLSIGAETVRWVQRWPGRGQANENKVPTVVVYPTGSSQPSSWGFLSETVAETTADNKDYKEWFKTALDPHKLRQKQIEDPESAPQSLAEVEKWYEDYLRKMYEYLAFKLGPEISGPRWEDARIEFIFSVPTTWTTTTVESFRNIVEKAGYGTHPKHSVSIGLTEAEAAAVHISTEAPGIFKERDILLVCDAGGGTTDLSVLRVAGTSNHDLTLEQLDVVFGETIGSAAIDYEFEKLVLSRIEEAEQREPLPISSEDAAWEMMKSRDFQSVKCECGSPDDTPLFSIAIPRAPQSYTIPELRIKGGEMTFAREDLQRMFDKQITKLCKLIDTQLQSLLQKLPNAEVAHLVLSGGLGNSAYVQSQLRARYSPNSPNVPPNARNILVRIAPDPQLAVCKGLVSDRVRKITSNKSILSWRCARASYGTVCKILYDKKNPEHQNMILVKDDMNGKMYITQAIAWFVKKGEPVSAEEPLVHNFVKKLGPGDPRRAFPTSVVTSDLDARFLPTQMNNTTRILCEIHSDLSSADEGKFVSKNKRFWSLGKPYFKIEYQVRVIIGPADIRFELWFANQKLSRDEPIKVEWNSVPPPSEEMFKRGIAQLPDEGELRPSDNGATGVNGTDENGKRGSTVGNGSASNFNLPWGKGFPGVSRVTSNKWQYG